MVRVNRSHLNGFLFGITLWLYLLARAWGEPAYIWQSIDIDLNGTTDTSIHGINAQGDVVGTFTIPTTNGFPPQGFLLPHARVAARQYAPFTDLGNVTPEGINSQDQVVGGGYGGCNGFLYQQGALTSICPPFPPHREPDGSGPPLFKTMPMSINDESQIVGRSADPIGLPFGFLAGQGPTVLFYLPWEGYVTMLPTGINNHGVIVGSYIEWEGATRGFRKDGDTVTRFDRPGGCCTLPMGLNDAGVIVGLSWVSSDLQDAFESFVYDSGTFTTVAFPGALHTTVRDINNAGQLVGDYSDDTGFLHGFLATPSEAPAPPVAAPAFALVASVLGDFNGDGYQDLAGLDAHGNIWVNITLSAGWRNIPGHLDTLVVGDFDGDGRDDLAGLQTANGSIWVTTDLHTWHWIPGTLNTLVAGDFDGDGIDDLAGLQTSNGSIWYTTNLLTWQWIPGFLRTLGVQPLAGGLDSLFGWQGPCWWTWVAGVWYQGVCTQTVAGQ